MSLALEFKLLFKKLCESKCAKRAVAAGTYVDGIFVYAVNECNEKWDFGRGQTAFSPTLVCSRLSFADEDSPEALAACNSQHAEANLAEVLKLMKVESDGEAWVVGHYYACRPCAQALRAVGVREIHVREI